MNLINLLVFAVFQVLIKVLIRDTFNIFISKALNHLTSPSIKLNNYTFYANCMQMLHECYMNAMQLGGMLQGWLQGWIQG